MGHDRLVGEVIRLEADKATIQVYEETGTGYVSIRGQDVGADKESLKLVSRLGIQL